MIQANSFQHKVLFETMLIVYWVVGYTTQSRVVSYATHSGVVSYTTHSELKIYTTHPGVAGGIIVLTSFSSIDSNCRYPSEAKLEVIVGCLCDTSDGCVLEATLGVDTTLLAWRFLY